LGAMLSAPAGSAAARQATPAATPAAPPATPPAEPVNLTIIDVAGQSQLTQPMIDDYVAQNPEWVSGVEFTKATSPELAAKIQAQQAAGRADIHMVLTGTDGLSAGIEQDLWLKLLPDQESAFPNLMESLINPGAQELAQGFGINVVFGNYGPTFTYNPEMVPTPPTTVEELLAYATENSGQVMYARPANSGPGRGWIMSLPYHLGDTDPKNPETGWEKTWTYLEQLGEHIEYYPSGTGATMQELGQGSRAMVASTMGWDMNPRLLGTVPMDFKAVTFPNGPLLADAQFVVIPKGLDEDRNAVVLNLMGWMLRPEQQAKAYDQAYFYPGPAVKDVTLEMAPAESQEAVASVRRPEFDELIATAKVELPLDAVNLVKAFAIWDERIGSGKVT
ncbi:MAG: extracellular solute-binding protein, partial [Chloroflexota bacterium]|nr:extracellular solute-binding protein [Chloroflexota bacterium]